MNWTAPRSVAERVALEREHLAGRVIRRRSNFGWQYAPAAEFESAAAEIHAGLLELREVARPFDAEDVRDRASFCFECERPHDLCDCPDTVQARSADRWYDFSTGK